MSQWVNKFIASNISMAQNSTKTDRLFKGIEVKQLLLDFMN